MPVPKENALNSVPRRTAEFPAEAFLLDALDRSWLPICGQEAPAWDMRHRLRGAL